MKRDVSGNFYLAGRFQLTSDFDPGPGVYNVTSNGYYDVFVEKLDSNGNFLWMKSLGGVNQDEASDLSID